VSRVELRSRLLNLDFSDRPEEAADRDRTERRNRYDQHPSLLDPTPYVRARLLLLQKFGKPLLNPNYSGGHIVR
jgi:hypothetical protein